MTGKPIRAICVCGTPRPGIRKETEKVEKRLLKEKVKIITE